MFAIRFRPFAQRRRRAVRRAVIDGYDLIGETRTLQHGLDLLQIPADRIREIEDRQYGGDPYQKNPLRTNRAVQPPPGASSTVSLEPAVTVSDFFT